MNDLETSLHAVHAKIDALTNATNTIVGQLHNLKCSCAITVPFQYSNDLPGTRKRARHSTPTSISGSPTTGANQRKFHYCDEILVLELNAVSEGAPPRYCVLLGWGVWMCAQELPRPGTDVCGKMFNFRVPEVKVPANLTTHNRLTLLQQAKPADLRQLQLRFPSASTWKRHAKPLILDILQTNSKVRHPPLARGTPQTDTSKPGERVRQLQNPVEVEEDLLWDD